MSERSGGGNAIGGVRPFVRVFGMFPKMSDSTGADGRIIIYYWPCAFRAQGIGYPACDERIEAIYPECDELIYTESMHERKQTMEEKADAFIIAPGGIGTMEEFFEALTLKQLGRHTKPIAIFNVNGFYDYLEKFMYVTMEKKFIRANCDLLYLTFTDLDELFQVIAQD